MKKYILISLFIILFSTSIFAQASEGKGEEFVCPHITIVPPTALPRLGETMTYQALITKAEGKEYKIDYYKWTVDKGKITEGQGTTKIKISTKGLKTLDIAATIEITALPEDKNCETKFSSVGIPWDPPDPRLLDEFGEITVGGMKARIDSLFIYLQNDEDYQGYIINYGSAREIAGRERFIKNYTRMRKFDDSRIVFVNGGQEKSIRTRLWIVPAGADPSEID